jgi:hypothetical protein
MSTPEMAFEIQNSCNPGRLWIVFYNSFSLDAPRKRWKIYGFAEPLKTITIFSI